MGGHGGAGGVPHTAGGGGGGGGPGGGGGSLLSAGLSVVMVIESASAGDVMVAITAKTAIDKLDLRIITSIIMLINIRPRLRFLHSRVPASKLHC